MVRRGLDSRNKRANSNSTEYIEKRLELGITQVELARRIGCGVTTLRNWETGKRRPNKFDRKCLENALGMEEKITTTGRGAGHFVVNIRAVSHLTGLLSVRANSIDEARSFALEESKRLRLDDWDQSKPEDIQVECVEAEE